MPAWDREPQATTLTKPHQRLLSLLRTMGFYPEEEVRVGKFSLDCYVREIHCGFECDGKRYHAGVAKGKKDRARDKWIFENAGIPVLRIQHDAIQWRLWEELKLKIEAFIEEHAKSLDTRQAKGRALDI